MEPEQPEKAVPTALGRRVRALRQANGLTQVEMAKRLGIKQPSLSDIETGETQDVSGSVLTSLCRELRTSVAYLTSPDTETDTDFGELVMMQQEAAYLLSEMPADKREAAIASLRGIAGALASVAKPFGNQLPPAQAQKEKTRGRGFKLAAAEAAAAKKAAK